MSWGPEDDSDILEAALAHISRYNLTGYAAVQFLRNEGIGFVTPWRERVEDLDMQVEDALGDVKAETDELRSELNVRTQELSYESRLLGREKEVSTKLENELRCVQEDIEMVREDANFAESQLKAEIHRVALIVEQLENYARDALVTLNSHPEDVKQLRSDISIMIGRRVSWLINDLEEYSRPDWKWEGPYGR